jgi:hypothetical protein
MAPLQLHSRRAITISQLKRDNYMNKSATLAGVSFSLFQVVESILIAFPSGFTLNDSVKLEDKKNR